MVVNCTQNLNIKNKMKKITLILSAAAIACTMGLTSCKKKTTTEISGCMDPIAFNYNKDAKTNDGSCQLPQTDVKAAIYDITGLWCHVCGELGIPVFDQVNEDMKGTVVPFSVHSSDAFSSAGGDALLAAYLKTTSVPSFGVGSCSAGLIPCYTPKSSGVSQLKIKINPVLGKDCIVGTNLQKVLNGNTLTVTTNTKFMIPQTGTEYYMATYILESGLVADQITDHGTIAMTHNHVIRHCFNTTSVYGDLIGGAAGAATPTGAITKAWTKTIPATWKAANLSIATIIFYKDAQGKMQFENANILE